MALSLCCPALCRLPVSVRVAQGVSVEFLMRRAAQCFIAPSRARHGRERARGLAAHNTDSGRDNHPGTGGACVVLARKQINSVVDGQGRDGRIRRFVGSLGHHTNGASDRHHGGRRFMPRSFGIRPRRAVFGAYDRACSASCRSLCWTSA
jgi:hypothetical protein